MGTHRCSLDPIVIKPTIAASDLLLIRYPTHFPGPWAVRSVFRAPYPLLVWIRGRRVALLRSPYYIFRDSETFSETFIDTSFSPGPMSGGFSLPIVEKMMNKVLKSDE